MSHPVDRFIRSRLHQEGLVPNPEADRPTLIRRAAFLLTGLPPTPSEVAAFVSDTAPDAWPRAVDRLLSSPRYGERWARWWLDLARYADTNGQDENKVMANAWRYRDWVVRQFNADAPMDQFLTDQLAGDLLPTNGVPEATVADRVTATGFLVLGPKLLAEQDKPKLVMDIIDEQIDTIGRAFLGLTVSCARCHDHKSDPIPTRDYYALAGILRSTRTMANLDFVSKFHERDITPPSIRDERERHSKALADARMLLETARRDAAGNLKEAWREAFPTSLRTALSGGPGEPSSRDDTRAPLAARLRSFLDGSDSNPSLRTDLEQLAASRDPDLLRRFADPESHRAALRITEGRDGNAFRATGSNHVARAHSPELEPQRLQVEAWVRPDAFPDSGETRRWIVAKNANEWTEGHYALVLDRNRPGAYLNIGGGRTNVAVVWAEAARLEAGRWHHLSMAYDGRTLEIRVDGHADGRIEVGRARTPGDGPLVIGMRPDGHVHFQGAIDTVRIGKHPTPTSGSTTGDPGPDAGQWVAEWTFDDLPPAETRAARHAELHARLFGPGGPAAVPDDPSPWLAPGTRERLTDLERQVADLEAHPPPPARTALAVEEDHPVDLPVHRRGSHLSPEPTRVPRGFLKDIGAPVTGPVPATNSGRLELARWLTAEDHPLTTRVWVNRVWQAHFGNGLTRTPDNFGPLGEPPTHPELLDWLACAFRNSGWSLKHLHRLLLTSETWRQSAVRPAGVADPDPDDRLLARFPRQRLEAEMVRDAMLAVSGRLDSAVGGSLTPWKNNEYVPRDEVSADSVRRSIYLPVVRDRVHDVLATFDFAHPAVGVARRTPTVVVQQALFLLNSPLSRQSGRALALRLLEGDGSDSDRIARAWMLLYGRPPAREEAARALRFLKPTGDTDRRTLWTEWCQVLLASNEFLHIE